MKKYLFILLLAASIFGCIQNKKDGTINSELLQKASKESLKDNNDDVERQDGHVECDCDGEGRRVPDINSLPSNYTGKFYSCFKDQCKVEVTGYLLNGKRHTNHNEVETWYYENGAIKCIGRFYAGKETRDWEWYFPNGNIKMTGHYVEGNKSGKWETFYENGQISERQEYGIDYNGSIAMYGSPVGKRESWYENGQPEFVGNTKGRYIRYFENGQIEIEGGSWGEYTEYYKSGQVKIHGKKLPGDIKDSIWYYYDDRGHKIKFEKYSKGKLL